MSTQEKDFKAVDTARVMMTPAMAAEILSTVPQKAYGGLNRKLVKNWACQIEGGRWPNCRVIIHRDGILYRGLNILEAIVRARKPAPISLTQCTDRYVSGRAEAIEQGLKRYRSDKPCKHGHTDERFTSCGRCVTCHKLKKHRTWMQGRAAKKVREKKYGFDPWDRRLKRKERGLGLSDRPDLVRLRDKRKRYGRNDRKLKQPEDRPGTQDAHSSFSYESLGK